MNTSEQRYWRVCANWPKSRNNGSEQNHWEDLSKDLRTLPKKSGTKKKLTDLSLTLYEDLSKDLRTLPKNKSGQKKENTDLCKDLSKLPKKGINRPAQTILEDLSKDLSQDLSKLPKNKRIPKLDTTKLNSLGRSEQRSAHNAPKSDQKRNKQI